MDLITEARMEIRDITGPVGIGGVARRPILTVGGQIHEKGTTINLDIGTRVRLGAAKPVAMLRNTVMTDMTISVPLMRNDLVLAMVRIAGTLVARATALIVEMPSVADGVRPTRMWWARTLIL
jgi:hypothetical protein